MQKKLSYGKQHIDKKDIDSVIKVLKSEFLTQGSKIEEFEKVICRYTGAKYSVVVANGTAALHLAVAALDIKKGHEGITSPNTFMASSNCLIYNSIKPVFADIKNDTYNIDPEQINNKITKKTKVIIPVHFAGQPADMEKICRIAKKNNLFVIEDAAHAIGSKYKNGKKVGNCQYSDMTTFSFHPVKTITSAEGGAITTNNKSLYEKLLMLRTHGITKDPKKMSKNPGPWYHEMQLLGYNYRLSDIHAALGISQMKKINYFIKRRRQIVKQYNKAFKNISWLEIPYEESGLKSVFHLYVIKIDFKKIGLTRKKIMQILQRNNIFTQVHYIPVHTQPYYKKNFGYKNGDYPKAEKYYEQTLSLPLYPDLTVEDVNYVINQIKLLG